MVLRTVLSVPLVVILSMASAASSPAAIAKIHREVYRTHPRPKTAAWVSVRYVGHLTVPETGSWVLGGTFDQDVRLLDIVPLIPGAVGEGVEFSPAEIAPLDIRDDVFGLAALAYEMLTGRHPFNHCAPDSARESVPRPHAYPKDLGANRQPAGPLCEAGPDPEP